MQVLLTGAFSVSNKGDAARIKATVRGLRAHLSSAEFSFISSDPSRDAVILEGEGIDVVDRYARGKKAGHPTAGGKALKLALGVAHLCIARLTGGRIVLRYAVPFAEADLIVDLSGESLSDYYGPANILLCIYPMVAGLLLGTPVVVFAQSIGPLKKAFDLRLVRVVLSRVSLLIVRDRSSLLYLDQYAISNKRTYLGADPAFLLDAHNTPRVQHLRREILQSTGSSISPIVGLSLSRGGYRRATAAESAECAYESMLGQIVLYIEWLISSMGAHVFFLPHVASRSEQDIEVGRRIQNALPNGMVLHLLPNDLSAEECKALMPLFDVFVGSRMHADISALSVGTPTIAIAYSHKLPSLMQELGLGDYAIHVGDVNAGILASATTKLLSSSTSEREDLAKRVRSIQKVARDSISRLAGLAEREGFSCVINEKRAQVSDENVCRLKR